LPAKKALPLTVTGGVLALLMVVVDLLPRNEAMVGDASEDASKRAVEPFMIAKPSGTEAEMPGER
jgi:hypothetical protein